MSLCPKVRDNQSLCSIREFEIKKGRYTKIDRSCTICRHCGESVEDKSAKCMRKQGTNVGNVRLGRLSLSEQKQNENLYLLNTFIISCSSVFVSSWKDDKTNFSSVESSIILRVFVVPQWYIIGW